MVDLGHNIPPRHKFRLRIISGEEEHCDVGENCIIGVHRTREGYKLFYVTEGKIADDVKAEEQTTFKSLPIQNPSDDVIRDFSQNIDKFLSRSIASNNDETLVSLHVIVSTGSGKQYAQTCFDRLVEPFLEEMGLKSDSGYTLHVTESAETIMDLTKSIFLPRAKKGAKQSIILLSGDGGVIDVINGLLSSSGTIPPTFARPRIALIPTGTGNALANSTGVIKDHTLGLATLFRGRPRPLPLFKVRLSSGNALLDPYGAPVPSTSPLLAHLAAPSSSDITTVYGAVVFSYGLHACLVADSDTVEYRKHGAERFKMAATDLLFPPDDSLPHEYCGRVSVSRKGNKGDYRRIWEKIPRDTHAYVLATLVAQLEKGFTISPASEPLDGKLRFVHFGPMGNGGKDIMGIMQGAYSGGSHVEDERVGYEEVEGVKIEFGVDGMVEEEKWRRVCVDGKIFRMGSETWVIIEREEERPVELMWLDR